MRADHFETLFRLSVSCHRYAVRFLYFAYDDDAVQAAYAVNVSQGVEHEVLIIFHVARIYPDTEELISDLAAAYRQVIAELYAAGCRNIQFDDCTWGMIIDDDYWKAMAGTSFTLKSEAERYQKVNNLALQDKPADIVINTHICRGNYHSTWASKGAYDPVAPYVFAKENVSAFYLEYDDERSGGFEPLKYIPEYKKVVLGLITTKSPVLEDKDAVKRRIEEASKYVSLDRLYLSPQCGFASCEIGNKLTEEQQWAKIDLVREIAAEVWK